MFADLNHALHEQVRIQAGREREPSGAIIDSHTVKTTEKGVQGYDGGKKVSGRKRHLLVDTLVLALTLQVQRASRWQCVAPLEQGR